MAYNCKMFFILFLILASSVSGEKRDCRKSKEALQEQKIDYPEETKVQEQESDCRRVSKIQEHDCDHHEDIQVQEQECDCRKVNNAQEQPSLWWWQVDGSVLLYVGGVALSVIPRILDALGFTRNGIARNSWAAAYQRKFLRGCIASGSLFALAQSAAAGGLHGIAVKILISIAGFILGKSI